MKLSVALATYNGEKYILELLESIKNQTRKVDEVIICDDCSKDNTVELVSKFIKENDLIGWQIFVNEKNLGYGENFKGTINKATGDIVFPCDQDDIWVRDKAEKMEQVFIENENIGLLCSDYATFYSDKKEQLINYYRDKENKVKKIKLNYYSRFLRFPGCVMAIKREFYEENKKYWYSGWAQDEFVWCVSLALDKCYYYHYCSLLRRFHDGQVSIKKSDGEKERIKYLKSEIECSTFMLDFIKENGLNKKAVKIYSKCVKVFNARLELVEKRKLRKAFYLLFNLKCYKFKKSFIKELKLAIKG